MNSLHRDYAAHCIRAKEQGFTQVPYTWYLNFRAAFYKQEGWV